MERVRFERTVLSVIRLSREEFETLAQACLAHYSSDVKGLIIPGEGAVLNGARVELFDNPDIKVVDIRATTRQIDILCKATECLINYEMDPKLREARKAAHVGYALHAKLRSLFQEANQEWVRLNPDLV